VHNVRKLKKCKRCNHEWLPRSTTKEIVTCPKCRSPYWNIEKQNDTGDTKNERV
jgi:Zn finger protein HypA/HybF involved in hydrogenase expression